MDSDLSWRYSDLLQSESLDMFQQPLWNKTMDRHKDLDPAQ